MLEWHVAPHLSAVDKDVSVGVEFPLSAGLRDLPALLHDKAQIPVLDEGSVVAVESQQVAALLVGNRDVRNGRGLGLHDGEAPPEGDAIEVINDFLVLVQGQDELRAVLAQLGAEAAGGAAAGTGEVGLDVGEGGAAVEAVAEVLAEGDVDVGVKVVEELPSPQTEIRVGG